MEELLCLSQSPYFPFKNDSNYCTELVSVHTLDPHQHRSDIHLNADHIDLYAKAESDNLYKTFDEIIRKIEHQIQRHKKRSKIH